MKTRVRMGMILTAALLCALLALGQQAAQQSAQQQGRAGAPAAGAPARGAQDPAAQGRGGRGGAPRTKKRVLAWADSRNGVAQHEGISHALAVLERIGYESGTYDMQIRTDSEIVAFKPLKTDGKSPASGGPSLSTADAVLFAGHREIPLSDVGKADLVSFIKDQGKGFVALYIGMVSWDSWPEMANILGAKYVGHGPFRNQPGQTLVNESPDFPATKHIPANWTYSDEFYLTQNYSRDNIQVLLRLDLSKFSPVPQYTRTDGDYPVAWAKMYGKGRVFYASLGHETKDWDNSDLSTMYFEALKWALGLTPYEIKPHPLPAGVTPPSGAATKK
jgi:type 1 glutamine amidotransferase